MILRSIATAARRQDWFVVFIELMIVVVGIYIGLQVDDWNKARQDRAAEARLMERLHEGILQVNDFNQAGYDRTAEDTAFLNEVVQTLSSDAVITALEDAACQAIGTSHILIDRVQQPTILGEMIATGRTASLQNQPLREILAAYGETLRYSEGLWQAILNQIANLSAEFPELVEARFEIEGEELLSSHICHVAGMQANKGFMSQLNDNLGRNYAFQMAIINRRYEQLLIIHDIVDQELGITHEGEGE